jgi:beta-1,4-galactosyltransferase 4
MTYGYSFIFPFRNRWEHLSITIPRLREFFPKEEFIVVEQNDEMKFRRANLLNEGAKSASGNMFIFHDIDYYPAIFNGYASLQADVFLPVRRVHFMTNDLQPKPIEEVPGGYRHFRDEVDGNFFGAVSTFTKDAFYHINGFSPMYVGWGFEDADLRERVNHYRLKVLRGMGEFYALDHKDSGPPAHDEDFLNNIRLSQIWHLHLDKGVKNQHSKVENVAPKHPMIDKWIMATGFDGPPKQTHIVSSRFNWDEGDE